MDSKPMYKGEDEITKCNLPKCFNNYTCETYSISKPTEAFLNQHQ